MGKATDRAIQLSVFPSGRALISLQKGENAAKDRIADIPVTDCRKGTYKANAAVSVREQHLGQRPETLEHGCQSERYSWHF